MLTYFFLALFFQDAYALCRVFKKSLNIPKIGDHYTSATAAASDRSSSIDPYSADDIESFDYAMPTATVISDNNNNNSNYHNVSASAASSSNIIHGSSPMNTTSTAAAPTHDSRWMQYLSDEAFSFNNNPSFPNYMNNMPYPPSKVKFTTILYCCLFYVYFRTRKPNNTI